MNIEEQKSRRSTSRLSLTGLVLSLVVLVASPAVLLVFVLETRILAGMAIDSYDESILNADQQATLDGAASAIGWILLASTVIGITAMVLGILTARTSRYGIASIVFAGVAPALCLFVSIWTLGAAAAPNHIGGAGHIGTAAPALASPSDEAGPVTQTTRGASWASSDHLPPFAYESPMRVDLALS